MNHLFLTLLMLIVAAVSVIHGSVIRVPTIDNPCMNDPTSTGTPQYASLRDQVQLTITAANTADTKCQLFKDALGLVLTSIEISGLSSPLVNVPGVPLGANEPTMTAANNISSFQQDYEDVSIYIRYLEFLRTAQLASDAGRFLLEIDAVNTQFYTWLCTINTILIGQNSYVTEFVSSFVVSESVIEYVSDSKSRYKLNYALMNNAQDFITHKDMKLAIYFQTLS